MLTLLLPALIAHASAAEPAEPYWHTKQQVAASYFPIGLRYAYSGEYRIPLWDKPGSTLFGTTYWAPGVYFEVTPAYARIGPRISFSPIAVFDVSAEAIGFAYFGTFSGVTLFDSPDAYFGKKAVQTSVAGGCPSAVGDPSLCFPDTVIAHEHDVDGKNGGYGARITISPTLKAKAGPIVVAIPAEFHHFMIARPKGQTGDWFYEPQLDALLGLTDNVLTVTPVAFYTIRVDTDDDPRFVWAGLRADYQNVFGSGDVNAKLGPIVVFKPGRSKAVPTLVAFTQAYLVSPIHPMFPPYVAAAAIW